MSRPEGRLAALIAANSPPGTFPDPTYECLREADGGDSAFAALSNRPEALRNSPSARLPSRTWICCAVVRPCLCSTNCKHPSRRNSRTRPASVWGWLEHNPPSLLPVARSRGKDVVDLAQPRPGTTQAGHFSGGPLSGGTIQQEFPYVPPGEYDVTLVFRRLVAVAGSASDIIISLPVLQFKSYGFGIRNQADLDHESGLLEAGRLPGFVWLQSRVRHAARIAAGRSRCDVAARRSVGNEFQALIDVWPPVLALPSYRGIREGSGGKIKLDALELPLCLSRTAGRRGHRPRQRGPELKGCRSSRFAVSGGVAGGGVAAVAGVAGVAGVAWLGTPSSGWVGGRDMTRDPCPEYREAVPRGKWTGESRWPPMFLLSDPHSARAGHGGKACRTGRFAVS